VKFKKLADMWGVLPDNMRQNKEKGRLQNLKFLLKHIKTNNHDR
jgi:hypothetical protein